MAKTREFLYVSSGKLDRFGTHRLRSVKSFSASAAVQPASASLSVTADDQDDWQKTQVKLRHAVRAIGSGVRWYEDDGVACGDWVRFRGDFGYSILESRSFRLFLMTQAPATLRGEAGLLLFGSPGNAMLGHPPARTDVSDLDSYAGNLLTFIRDLAEADASGQDKPGLGERGQAAVQLFSRVAAAHDAAEHVEGIAKTANVLHGGTGHMTLPRLIIASPLYVAAEQQG